MTCPKPQGKFSGESGLSCVSTTPQAERLSKNMGPYPVLHLGKPRPRKEKGLAQVTLASPPLVSDTLPASRKSLGKLMNKNTGKKSNAMSEEETKFIEAVLTGTWPEVEALNFLLVKGKRESGCVQSSYCRVWSVLCEASGAVTPGADKGWEPLWGHRAQGRGPGQGRVQSKGY